MGQFWTWLLTTAGAVIVSLLVTYFFNKISGVPKKLSDEKKARQQKIDALETADKTLEAQIIAKYNELDTKIEEKSTELNTKFIPIYEGLTERIEKLEEIISRYPEYRAQSLTIQTQLKEADAAIVDLCKEIKDDVIANRIMLDERLANLESREKNSLRAKILTEYRVYTDEKKNPMLAWTEMEHHSFFKLVEDYENLGGNDYVHNTILPAMNELDVIPMTQLDKIKELYDSRSAQ